MVHGPHSGAKMEARSKVEHEMSLAALRRNDPYISGIIDVTGQVALYSFSAKANEWEKTDIEGTLFVYRRSASPHHGFTIMNRLNMNNLVEPINKDLEFQLHEPFLLYRNSSLSIYSIWFYDMNDCQRIAQLMTQVVKQELSRMKNRKSLNGTNGCSAGTIDILEMLSKAKNDYEKGQGNEFSSSATKNAPLVKSESLDTPEHASTSAPQDKYFQPGQKHLTVEELFGTFLLKEQHMSIYGPSEVKEPFLPDVEHNVFLQSKPMQPVIVKAEPRSFNCSASDFSHPACLPPALIPQKPVTQLDSKKMNIFPGRVSPSIGPSSEVLSTSAPHNSSLLHTRQMSPLMSQSISDVGSAPHTQPLLPPPLVPIRSSSFSSTSHPSVDLLQKLKLNPQVNTLPPQTMNKTTMAPKFSCATNQLATPECFKDSSLKNKSFGPVQDSHEKREPETFAQPLGVSKGSQFGAPTTTDVASVLWSPSVFQQPAQKHSSQDERTATPPSVNCMVDRTKPCCTGLAFSRPQLKETLVHLIKNDSSFLNTIHEAYIQVVAKSMDNVKL
ncbi:mRNA-decapping enzyme 1A isoform X2 [Hyla sarda]|uniref:mRNA-decapping enzyme 1A isoform X2 n=1 Tax=Hyla sarda TaxID=327740 RepID=UPI0024C365DF|nr:mRNA-decapping enzyme 1A isoform X2 [Hyla sarda]